MFLLKNKTKIKIFLQLWAERTGTILVEIEEVVVGVFEVSCGTSAVNLTCLRSGRRLACNLTEDVILCTTHASFYLGRSYSHSCKVQNIYNKVQKVQKSSRKYKVRKSS